MRHVSYEAVMHDRLPDEKTMRDLFYTAELNIYKFIDETGFYYIMAKKQ
jgi:hypothetical protein